MAMKQSFVSMLFSTQTGADQAKGQSNTADRQRVEAIEKAGGRVAAIAHNDARLEVDLHLQGQSVTDALLPQVSALKDVVHLNLGKSKITDAGLEQIKGMTTLTRLHLEETGITDKGLASLKGLTNLTYLNLYGTAVTDLGLEHLTGLTNLKNLYLWQTKVTEDGVKKLKNALPKLEIVTGWELQEKKLANQ
jgi:Leucine-rich repeat (LRR) protein